MGYYSDFEISIELGDESLFQDDKFQKYFETITGYTFDEFLPGIGWYVFEDHMKRISTTYPDVVFKVRWTGEESDDQGHYYFNNGKTLGGQAQLVYPTVDLTDFTNLKSRKPELFL